MAISQAHCPEKWALLRSRCHPRILGFIGTLARPPTLINRPAMSIKPSKLRQNKISRVARLAVNSLLAIANRSYELKNGILTDFEHAVQTQPGVKARTA